MKRFQKAVGMFSAICIMASVNAPVYAAEVSPVYSSNPMEIVVSPRTTGIRLDETFNENGDTSWTDFFDVPTSEKSYRVWVHNTGDVTLTVKICSESYTGTLQSKFTVAPGEQAYDDLRVGASDTRRYVTIVGTSGKPFSGRIRVRSATSSSEF